MGAGRGDEVLVNVERVSKKFCRSLKRSLWYGVQDISAEMFGRKERGYELRKNEFWAVNDISFGLKRGESLGLIGPNGAGKSTLLKMLNGLVKPDMGRITMRGRVGALIELGAGFNPILTARENIYVNGSVLGFSRKQIERKFDAIVDFAEIEEYIDTPVQNFSSGMKVRLGFAVAAQMEPDILLIDEVLAVGDARFRSKCYNSLTRMRKNAAIVFVSHSADQLARVCERGLVILRGRPLYSGDIYSALENFETHFASDRNLDKFLELLPPVVNCDMAIDRSKIDSGESLSISVRVQSKAATGALVVRISIFNSYGFISADCELEVKGLSKGRSKLDVVLPTVSLKKGSYSVSVNLIDPRGNFLVWSHRMCEFAVVRSQYDALCSSVLHKPEVLITHEN